MTTVEIETVVMYIYSRDGSDDGDISDNSDSGDISDGRDSSDD